MTLRRLYTEPKLNLSDKQRNDNVIITSKRRHNVVLT